MWKSSPSAINAAPTITMNASASIFTVGWRSMKSPIGLAAKIITSTASTIAATITGIWLTMPTAVITESSENTMSMTAICAITMPNTTDGRAEMSSSSP